MISRVNVTKSTFHNTSDPFRNVGKMDPKSKRVGTGLVGAPACGDVMKLQIEVRKSNLAFECLHVLPYKVDDDGKIVDAKFKTFGCGSAIASSRLDDK